jgi:Helicase associated domain
MMRTSSIREDNDIHKPEGTRSRTITKMMDGASSTSQKDLRSTKEGREEESVPSAPRSGELAQAYDDIRGPKRKNLDSDVFVEDVTKRCKVGDSSDATQVLLNRLMFRGHDTDPWPGAEEGNSKATETTVLRTRDSESRIDRIGSSSDDSIKKPRALDNMKPVAAVGRSQKAKQGAKAKREDQGGGSTSYADQPPSLEQNSTAEISASSATPSAVVADTKGSDDQDSDGVRIVKKMVAELKNQEKSDPTMVDGWYNWLDELMEHNAKHGHCQVRDAENHVLYSWLKRQRIMFRKGKLDSDKLRILQLLKTNGFGTPVNVTNIVGSPQVQQQAPQPAPTSKRAREAIIDVHDNSRTPGTQQPRRSTLQDAHQDGPLDAATAATPVRGLPTPLVSRATSQAEESVPRYSSTLPNPERMAISLQRGGSQLSFLPGVSPTLQTTAGTDQILSSLGYPNVRLPREDAPGHVTGLNRDRLLSVAGHAGSFARSANAAELLDRSLNSFVAIDHLLRLRQPTVTRLQNPLDSQNTLQHILLLRQQQQQQQQQQQLLLDDLLRRQLQGRDRDWPN